MSRANWSSRPTMPRARGVVHKLFHSVIRQLAVFGITSFSSADFMSGPYRKNRLASDAI